MQADPPTADDTERLNRIIADYMERLDRGESVDRTALLQDHPELAAQLQSYFASADFVDRLAAVTRVRAVDGLEPGSHEPASYVLGQASTHRSWETPPTRVLPSDHKRLTCTSIGRYEVLKSLGQGGMGTVFLVHDPKLKRNVALKLPRLDLFNLGESTDRFLIEAQAAAQIRHPHVCRIYDFGEIDNSPYYTMEFIEGEPLSERLSKCDSCEISDAASLILTLARAMQQPHNLGILHRDLKPSNIIITDGGEPVIVDFGLARDFGKAAGARPTETGMIIGTVCYSSPEQIGGKHTNQGPGVDIWSLGIILHELLTGKLPFTGSRTEMIAQILRDAPPAPSRLRPDVPEELDSICLKMLAREPAERYASMSDVAAALEAFLRRPAIPDTSSPTSSSVSAPRPLDHAAVCAASPADSFSLMSGSSKTSTSRRRLALGTLIAFSALLLSGIVITIRSGDQEWELKIPSGSKVEIREESDQTSHGLSVPLSPSEPQLEAKRTFDAATIQGGIKYLTSQPVLAICGAESIQFWEVSTLTSSHTVHFSEMSDVSGFDIHPTTDEIAIGGSLDVHVISRETGAHRDVLTRQERVLAPVRFSPDGNLVGYAKDDTTLVVASAKTLEELRTLPVHPKREILFEFSPDSRTLAAASQDATIVLFDVSDGQPRESIRTKSGEVSGISFHPNNHVLAIACGDTNSGHRVQLWDWRENKMLRTCEGHADRIDTLAFSPDGSFIATGSHDKTLRLWNTTTGKVVFRQAFVDSVDHVAFDPSGRSLAVGAGGSISVFRLPALVSSAGWEPGQFSTLLDHRGSVRTVIFSADGQTLYSAGGGTEQEGEVSDADIRVWDLRSLQLVKRIASQASTIVKLGVSMDGSTLVALSSQRTFEFWNPLTGDRLHDFDGVGSGVIGNSRTDDFAMLPDGQMVLVGPAGHTIVDTATLETVHQWPSPDSRIIRVAVAPEAARIVTGALNSGNIRVWSTSDSSELASVTAPGDTLIDTLDVVSDGHFAVSGSLSEYTAWNLGTRQQLATWPRAQSGSPFAQSVAAVTPDGAFVVTASHGDDGHRLIILNVITGEQQLSLPGHTDAINVVAISPDGQFAATGSNDKTVRIWKLPSPPDSEREAATWVLDVGGAVALSGIEGYLTQPDQLPEGTLAITGINLEGNPNVTDESLAHISRLQHLIELRLSRTSITDAAMRHLSTLRSLQILHLSQTLLNGPGLAELRDLKVLRHLELEGCPIANDGLTHLPPLANLRTLCLAKTNTNDAMLKHLLALPLLSYLDVSHTELSDESVPTLVQLKWLEHLRCQSAPLTEAGIAQLSAERPDLRIQSSP